MQELTTTEMEEVSGGGRAGGVIGNVTVAPLGGVRVGSGGAGN